MEVSGSHVLVTGGSRGIGKATALYLGKRGANVVITYRSNEAEAKRVMEEISASSGSCSIFQLDLGSEASIQEFTAGVLQLGSLDVIVNNAGEIPRPGNWDLLRGADLDRTIAANLTGHIRVLQGLVPRMQEHGGLIVNIVSTYAMTGAGAVMAYTAAKAGMIAVTHSLARDLGASKIRVNAIAPGNFATAMADEAGPGFVGWVESTAPLGRLGRPDEIGHGVAYLMQAEYVTGHTLVIDGGHILNM